MLTYRKEHKLSLTFLPVTFNEVMVKASQYVKQSDEGVLVELTAPELSPTLKWNTLLQSPKDLSRLPQYQLEILLDILMKAEGKYSKFELMDILNGMEIELAILVLIKNNSTESLQTSHIDFMQKAFSPILELKKEKVGRELFGEHYRKYIRKGKEQSRADHLPYLQSHRTYGQASRPISDPNLNRRMNSIILCCLWKAENHLLILTLN